MGERLDEAIERAARALDLDVHLAPAIRHEAAEAETGREPMSERTKTHTLHHAPNAQRTSSEPAVAQGRGHDPAYDAEGLARYCALVGAARARA
jgi:hypothetical protein